MTKLRQFIPLIFLGLLVLLPLITHDPYHLHVLTGIFIWGVMTTSLLITIRVGIFNFGHAAFMSIGAYISALLVTKLNFSFWLTLPIAGTAGSIVAVLIGIPTLRLKGMYFVLVTFVWLLVVSYAIASFPEYTNGWFGVANIPSPHLLMIDFSNKLAYYYLVLAFMGLSIFFLYRIWNSQIGKIYTAIRANDSLSQSIGIPVASYKIQTFAMASFFASVSGCFLAPLTGFIEPTMFTTASGINLFLWMVIGGSNSIFGPLVGVTVAILLTEAFRFMLAVMPIVFGAIIIIIILFLPEGIISGPKRISEWLARERG